MTFYLKVGDKIQALDEPTGVWRSGKIIKVEHKKETALIAFEGIVKSLQQFEVPYGKYTKALKSFIQVQKYATSPSTTKWPCTCTYLHIYFVF